MTNHRRRAGALLAVGGLLLLGWVSAAAGWLDWAAMARWAVHRAGSIVLLAIVVELVAAAGWSWLRRGRPRRPEPTAALSWWAVAGAGVVVAGVAWGATSWLLSEAGQAHDVAATRVEAIKTGLSIAAGTGGVFALLLAVRRQWHHELSAASTVHDATERRMTELYIKAVEQLGSDKAPVRLGGLYALERLAQDSPDRRQTVVNVLCAYLRMPFDAPDEIDDADGSRTATQEQQVRMTAQRIMTLHLRPGPDIERPIGSYWSNIDLDLTGARLMHLSLVNCQLRSARFNHARFSGRTELDRIRFARSVLFRAAVFDDDVTFRAARFDADVVFDGARLGGDVNFNDAHFGADASFERAEFTGASGFIDTTFAMEARFKEATFKIGTIFEGAKLCGATNFDQVRFGCIADFKDAAMPDSATFNGSAVLRRYITKSSWPAGIVPTTDLDDTDEWVQLIRQPVAPAQTP